MICPAILWQQQHASASQRPEREPHKKNTSSWPFFIWCASYSCHRTLLLIIHSTIIKSKSINTIVELTSSLVPSKYFVQTQVQNEIYFRFHNYHLHPFLCCTICVCRRSRKKYHASKWWTRSSPRSGTTSRSRGTKGDRRWRRVKRECGTRLVGCSSDRLCQL